MGTVYYHTPFIRIRSARCRINASNPPGRNYVFEENSPEYIEEQWSEEEISNFIHEHTFSGEDDIGGTPQFSSDLNDDYSDNTTCTDIENDDCHCDDPAESDFVYCEEYYDDTSEIGSENIEDNCEELGFDPGEDYSAKAEATDVPYREDCSENADYNLITDTSMDINDYIPDNEYPEEPANMLNLVPTLYWNYPYIRPGYRVHSQDQNLR